MNKAMYGILAAALLAAANRKSGATNTDIKQGIKSLLKNNRKDVALATIYSFIDLTSVGDLQGLSSISNVDISVPLIQQPLFLFPLVKDKETLDSFVEVAYNSIVSSFGSEELAQKAWKQSSSQLVNGYKTYFIERDYGVAYSYILLKVYPRQLNIDDWFSLFRDSKTYALSLVYTQALKGKEDQDKEESYNRFLSAWLKSQMSESQDSDVFDLTNEKELLEFKNIFDTAGEMFYLISSTQEVEDLEIKGYPVQFIYNLLEQNQGSLSSFIEKVKDNFFMLDLVIKSLVWLKDRLSLIKDERGEFKYPLNTIDTYKKMWNFWNDPTRVGSQPMIYVEMDYFRKNKITSTVPQVYKKEKGLMESFWSDSGYRGTPAWATTSWIMYYIFNMVDTYETPSTIEWGSGLNIASNIFKALKAATEKSQSVLTKPRTIENLLKQLSVSRKTDIADALVKVIQEGTWKDFPFQYSLDTDTPLMGFNNKSTETIEDYADIMASFEGQNLKVYKPLSQDNQAKMLKYVAKYLGHCDTGSIPGSDVYVVYYDNVPFYTIEVSAGVIIQFKGIQNRGMGLLVEASKVRSNVDKTDLYFSDLNNISILLPLFRSNGIDFPQDARNSMYRTGDLKVYSKSIINSHVPPKELADEIMALTI